MKTGITLKNKDIRGFAAESALFWVRAMFSQAAGTREGKDIEHLHDMRVASRRLRECFQVFNAFYAPRKLKKVLSSVRNITRVLGRPRETDVNLSLLAAYQPGPSPILSTTHEYLLEIFEFEQARQRRKMLKQVGKIDRGALEDMLSRFAETARTSRSRPSLLTQVGQELEFEGFLSISSRDLRQNVAKIFAFEAAPSGEEYEARLHELNQGLLSRSGRTGPHRFSAGTLPAGSGARKPPASRSGQDRETGHVRMTPAFPTCQRADR